MSPPMSFPLQNTTGQQDNPRITASAVGSGQHILVDMTDVLLPNLVRHVTDWQTKHRSCGIGEIEALRVKFPDIPDETAEILRSLNVFLDDVVMKKVFSSTIAPKNYDPFNEFPKARLASLNLLNVDLYRSFQDITTLTEFTLCHSKFNNYLNTLLIFLEKNHALKNVKLHIGFKNPSHRRVSRGKVPINLEQLESLSVSGGCQEDIECLISHISLLKGTNLELSPLNEANIKLIDILSCIKAIAEPPTYMCMDWGWNSLKLSNGCVEIHCLSFKEKFSILEKHPLTSVGNIQELHFIGQNFTVFNPAALKTIKILTIEQDPGVSTTLSEVLSGLELPFDKLEIRDCTFSEDFMQQLRQYASKHNCTISWPDNRAAIVVKQAAETTSSQSRN